MVRVRDFGLIACLGIVIALLIILDSSNVSAGFSNVTVKSKTDLNWSDYWLGISTGGYTLISPMGRDYVFKIFVKNGNNNISYHNLRIEPQDFKFNINSISPKVIDQLKPSEIIVFNVNATIPIGASEGYYPFKVDVWSDEFPKGIFQLSTELKVVKTMTSWVYIMYGMITLILIAWLILRKSRMWKDDWGRKKEPE